MVQIVDSHTEVQSKLNEMPVVQKLVKEPVVQKLVEVPAVKNKLEVLPVEVQSKWVTKLVSGPE